MNAAVKLRHETEPPAPVDPLARLREPFPANQISKLPKPFKKDSPKGKCAECGGYHGLPAVHLDYVGHAALTDRLLDVDPTWVWEPVADPASLGLPVAPGGMWIKLTICGVSRYGFGHPDGKTGGDAVKETIGDALRNAAMRFGAALDLWHKGDLHVEPEGEAPPSLEEKAIGLLRATGVDKPLFKETWEKNKAGWKQTMDGPAYARVVRVMQEIAASFPAEPPPPKAPPSADEFGIRDDEIPF